MYLSECVCVFLVIRTFPSLHYTIIVNVFRCPFLMIAVLMALVQVTVLYLEHGCWLVIAVAASCVVRTCCYVFSYLPRPSV